MFEVEDGTFDEKVLKSDKPVLLYFWAETCKPCKMMKPDIEGIESGCAGKLEFAHTDAVANDDICKKCGVLSTPTVIMFNRGEAVLRLVGYVTRPELQRRIDEQLGAIA